MAPAPGALELLLSVSGHTVTVAASGPGAAAIQWTFSRDPLLCSPLVATHPVRCIGPTCLLMDPAGRTIPPGPLAACMFPPGVLALSGPVAASLGADAVPLAAGASVTVP